MEPKRSPLCMASPSKQAVPDNWETLSHYHRTAVQFLFCDALGMMLGVGVPILRSLDIVRFCCQRRRSSVSTRSRLRSQPASASTPKDWDAASFVAAMIDSGEERGTLDHTLIKAAEVLEAEL